MDTPNGRIPGTSFVSTLPSLCALYNEIWQFSQQRGDGKSFVP